jgi:hypothetical protein
LFFLQNMNTGQSMLAIQRVKGDNWSTDNTKNVAEYFDRMCFGTLPNDEEDFHIPDIDLLPKWKQDRSASTPEKSGPVRRITIGSGAKAGGGGVGVAVATPIATRK